MFRGVVDAVTFLIEPVDDARFAALLRHCAPFATTLQVSESRWPHDRATFEAYWAASVHEVQMDDVTRDYLRGIASLAFLPKPLARTPRSDATDSSRSDSCRHPSARSWD